eukprot:3161489-Heterocapsa_arctica.AAC.1
MQRRRRLFADPGAMPRTEAQSTDMLETIGAPSGIPAGVIMAQTVLELAADLPALHIDLGPAHLRAAL